MYSPPTGIGNGEMHVDAIRAFNVRTWHFPSRAMGATERFRFHEAFTMIHHLLANSQTVALGYWDALRKSVSRVASGDRVTVDTLSGDFEELPYDESLILPEHREVLSHAVRGGGAHLLTGPIWIEDAEPGDVLEVRIVDVQLRQDWGWNLIEPLLGTLPEDFPLCRRLHIPINRDRRVAHQNSRSARRVVHALHIDGYAGDLDRAARIALREMIKWIVELSDLEAVDGYTLCSIAADMHKRNW